MSLSQFSFLARTVQDMQSWFVDIMNHLSAKNYDNGEWNPVITGLSEGEPDVSAWWQRFGIECYFTIVIEGTHHLTDATITLPLTPNGYGVAIMHSITDNSTIGTARVDTSTGLLHIREYWVTNETVVIKGFYKVAGI